MFQQKKDWETRENAFAAFSMGPLTEFWRQREEAGFTGVGNVPVRFVRFRAEKTIGSLWFARVALRVTSNMPSWPMTFPHGF
jgi:lysophospholipase